MSEAIVVALITAGVSLVGTISAVVAANNSTLKALDKKSELSDAKLEAELKKHMAVTDTKIEELTREVREHNEFARRVPVLEEKVTQLEKKGA